MSYLVHRDGALLALRPYGYFVPQCKVIALRAFYYIVCIVEKTCT
jgi:hypothetical protein